VTGTAPAEPSLLADVFVGRDAELAVLRRVLAEAETGVGRVVVAHGGAGIGKTRLIAAVGRLVANAGGVLVVGRCQEVEGAPAFWPWIQALRTLVRLGDAPTLAHELGPTAGHLVGLVPELGGHAMAATPSLDPAVARFLLFDAAATVLRCTARRRPVVVALDDLHRADTASLRMLEFLVPHLREMSVVLLGTFRDSSHDLDHPLAATLSELRREPTTVHLPLQGLSEGEVGELIGRVTGGPATAAVVRRVYARTGGNPLFVTELARRIGRAGASGDATAALEAMPPEMQATIARDVHEATPACAAVLTAAAVFGRDVRTDVLAVAAGTSREDITTAMVEAVRRGLAEMDPEDPRRLRFTHVLTRDALYQGILLSDRAAWHQRAAEALDTVTHGEADRPLVDIAAHFARADDPRAASYARAAGDAARLLHAYETAAEQYALALATVERVKPFDPVLHAEVLLALAEAQRGGGAIETSKATVLRALASARARRDVELEARAALAYGVEFEYGEGAVVDPVHVGVLTEAIEHLGDRDDAVLVRLLGKAALARYWDAGAAHERDALSERAVAMARRLRDPEALLAALLARHVAIWTPGNLAERRAMAQEALALVTSSTDLRMAFQAHWLRAADHLEGNDMTTADVEIGACARIAERSRHPYHAFVVTGLRALRASMRGDFAASETLVAEARDLGRRWFPEFAQFAEMMLTIGNARRVEEWARFEAPLRAAAQAHPGAPTFHVLLGVVLCELGRLDEARAALHTLAGHGFAAVPRDLNMLVGLSFAADVAVAVGDARAAEALYDLLAPYERSNALLAAAFIWRGSISHRLGTMARVLGRFDAATGHLEAALACHTDACAAPWLAATQYEYALLLRERGSPEDHARARGLLDEARDACARLGLETLATRIAAVDHVSCPPLRDVDVGIFRLEGEIWTLSYGGKTVQIGAMRGLGYLATLLSVPNREIHATELVRPPSARATAPTLRAASTLGDAGPLLDARSHAAYRQRLARITEEIEDAERAGDLGRLQRARNERRMFVEELQRADQGRRAGSHAERARITVAKGLTRAFARIRIVHPELAKHLEATVRRGYVCVYMPDPRTPIRWEA